MMLACSQGGLSHLAAPEWCAFAGEIACPASPTENVASRICGIAPVTIVCAEWEACMYRQQQVGEA